MAHEIAKLILENAATLGGREDAVLTAISLGMPLQEIEEYLDWLDTAAPRKPQHPKHGKPRPKRQEKRDHHLENETDQ